MERRLTKQNCIDMDSTDWGNVKYVSAQEIARCLVLGYMPVSVIPQERMKRVDEELDKYRHHHAKPLTDAAIATLAKKQSIQDDIDWFSSEYDIDNELFLSPDEVVLANSTRSYIYQLLMQRIMEDQHRYKDNTFSRDIKRRMDKLSPTDNEAREKLLALAPVTLKQELESFRSIIVRNFTEIGTSPTRSDAIAKSITQELLLQLK